MTMYSALAIFCVIPAFTCGFILGTGVESWSSRKELEADDIPLQPKGLDLDKLSPEQKRELLG